MLFIAEKPSMGRAIAESLGVIKNHSVKGVGHIECKNGNLVTWCFGHLLAQEMPDAYLPDTPVNPKTGKKIWRMEDLPVVPEIWRMEVPKSSAAQFKVIKQLLNAAKEAVNAGDPDREGQLLVDEVLEYLNYKGKVLRLWVQALDAENIEKALKNLKDNKQYYNFMLSALGRSRADWLVGLNLTRAYTVKSGRLITVGRVQTPTLNLVVERDLSIENFIPKDYFVVWANIDHKNGRFKAILKPDLLEKGIDEENRLIDANIAEIISQTVKNKPGKITDVKNEKKSQDPPMPFMLSSLQKFASSAWGWSAKKTLDTLQILYEKKLTSYPRTDCSYLPEEEFVNAGQLVNKLKTILPAGSNLVNLNIKHKCWNTKKITAHTGIVPTKDITAYGSLNPDEKKLYERIILSFYLIFAPSYEYIAMSVKLNIENYIFTASGTQVLKQGFKALAVKEEKAGEDAPENSLPPMAEGDAVKSSDSGVDAKKTTPPSRFTDGTLIDAMCHIYKYITDEESKKILKETDGIGTEATRANTIEELVRREFLERKGKQIISTAQGKEIIGYLPASIKDPVLTAKWESYLSEIAAGSENIETFINNQTDFIRKEIEKIKGLTISVSKSDNYKPKSGGFKSSLKSKSGPACPSCKASLVILKTKSGKPYFRCFECKSCFWPDKNNKPGTKWSV
jgi:DNA topoisomerase-3